MLVQLPGDVFLGAAAVAYFGAFSGVYRRELVCVESFSPPPPVGRELFVV